MLSARRLGRASTVSRQFSTTISASVLEAYPLPLTAESGFASSKQRRRGAG